MTTSRNIVDIAAGGVLVALGLFAASYAMLFYRLGTLNNMGPGMFPAIVGVITAILGAAIVVPALLREEVFTVPTLEARPAVAVLAAIGVFAVSIRMVGLMPAVILMTVIAALAEDEIRPWSTLVLAVALAIAAALIFVVGLRLPIAVYVWPF